MPTDDACIGESDSYIREDRVTHLSSRLHESKESQEPAPMLANQATLDLSSRFAALHESNKQHQSAPRATPVFGVQEPPADPKCDQFLMVATSEFGFERAAAIRAYTMAGGDLSHAIEILEVSRAIGE